MRTTLLDAPPDAYRPMICAIALAASSGASATVRLARLRRKRTPESGDVSTVTASWVTPASLPNASSRPAHEATYASSTSSSASPAPCGWQANRSEYSPVCPWRTRVNRSPNPSLASTRETLDRMPGSRHWPDSTGASMPDRYRARPLRDSASQVRRSTVRSSTLRCSRSRMASTVMAPMPTAAVTMAATTLTMDSIRVTTSTPRPARVRGLPMLRMPPAMGRIQSP